MPSLKNVHLTSMDTPSARIQGILSPRDLQWAFSLALVTSVNT